MTTIRRFNKLRELENRAGGSDADGADADRLDREFEAAYRVGDGIAVGRLYGLIVKLRCHPILNQNRLPADGVQHDVETPRQAYDCLIGRTLGGD